MSVDTGCFTIDTFNIMKDMFQLAFGVDPNQGGTHRMTSDEFFVTNQLTFDVIFIDGWDPGGTIMMHDCNPTIKISQLRVRQMRDDHSEYMLGYCWSMRKQSIMQP